MTIDHSIKIKPQNSFVASDEFGNVTETFLGSDISDHSGNDETISLLDNFLTKFCCCVFWAEPWNVCMKSLCLFDCVVVNRQIKYSFCKPLSSEESECFCPHDFDYCDFASNNHNEHYILACIVFIVKIFLNTIYCVAYLIFLCIFIPIFLIALIPICMYLSVQSIKNSVCQFLRPIFFCYRNRNINNDNDIYDMIIQID